MENIKKRRWKRKSSAIAGAVLVIALLLSGTYAYSSVSQMWKNETKGTVDYDVILHDDFVPPDDYANEESRTEAYLEGIEKSVYVENYGPSPLYVRVRLDEYMEVGKYAGMTEAQAQAQALADGDLTQEQINQILADGGSVKKADALVSGALLEDVTTWKPHVPLNQNAPDDCHELFHDYWTWTMGGNKYYLPFINQPEENYRRIDGVLQAIQDVDSKQGDANVLPTLEAEKVITMAQWKQLGMPGGNFWVIDADGWAYWAAPLNGNNATGLLLSGLQLQVVPNDDYYYAINVIMQAASEGDWQFDGEFDNNIAPTDDALALLNKISNSEATIKSVSVEHSVVYVKAGEQAALNASVVSANGGSNTVTWKVDSTSGSLAGTVSVAKGSAGNEAIVSTSADSAGKVALISAAAVGDPSKFATTKVIVVPNNIEIVKGADGKMYVDYGDNTFSLINDDGILGTMFWGGNDLKPGTGDDRSDLYVAPGGNKYLGPNANGSYEKLPSGDLVWKQDPSLEIGPDNETSTPPVNPGSMVKSIVVSPSAATVAKGSSQTFTAVVTMGDDSINNDGVTWSLNDTTKGSKITSGGELTVGANETNTTLMVQAASKTDGTTVGTATITVKAAINNGAPVAVAGRVLTAAKAGDNSAWIEIAQNGDYSLIVRATSLSTAVVYGTTNAYGSSNVRTNINTFYAGLAANSGLRRNAVTSDAASKLGTWASLTAANGFSVPSGVAPTDTSDVAFALSFQEAANYCSAYWSNGNGTNSTASVTPASTNFTLLKSKGDGGSVYSWLRSVGSGSAYASHISTGGTVYLNYAATAKQSVRPALWVKSDLLSE